MIKKIICIIIAIIVIRLVVMNSTYMNENKEKAISVLKSLQSGDPAAMGNYISTNYKQHNLDFPTGRDVMINALPDLKKCGTTIDIKRVIEDGNYVALHSNYNFFGQKVGFDVFRFENGKIIEHWDNLQDIPTKTASGHLMAGGPTEIKDLEKTHANKQFVESFVKDILRDGKSDKITQYISSETYIQHNPNIGDGLSGLAQALDAMAKKGIVMKYDTIHNVIGQGNFVLTISEGQFDNKHVAFYDLFCVENNRIVEHWDVIQEIPPKEVWKNQNGKF